MRSRAVPVLALAALLTLAVCAQAVALPRTWSGYKLRVRPASIWLSGDATEVVAGTGHHAVGGHAPLGRLHWTRYRSSRAVATGSVWLNDCRPICAAGHFHPYSATVTLTRVRHNRFTRLELTYVRGGRRHTDHRKLTPAPRRGYFFWDFAR
jgi:hypothetical protein